MVLTFSRRLLVVQSPPELELCLVVVEEAWLASGESSWPWGASPACYQTSPLPTPLD